MSFPVVKGRREEGDEQAVQQEGERHSRKLAKRWRGIEIALELRSRRITTTVRTHAQAPGKTEPLRLALTAEAAAGDSTDPAASTDGTETTTTSTTYAVAFCVTPPDTSSGPQ
jgi:hypothetical protein